MSKRNSPGAEKKRTTIYDVARHAGVSPATVSHVLNSTAPISQETQERIFEAIRALDYRRNANARSLRTQSSQIIGVILQDISSEYYAQSAAAVLECAQKQGLVVLTCDLHFDHNILKKSVTALVERRVDGLIFIGGAKDESAIRMALASGVPVVLGDRYLEGFPCVEFNNFDTVRSLTLALGQSGYRRFGYFGEKVDWQENLSRRFGGFMQGLDDLGIPESDRTVVLDPVLNFAKMGRAYERFGQLIEETDPARRPQVVLTSNDMVAQGAISASLRHGLRVPEDIAIVGFDNISIAQYSIPSITTVAQDPSRLGVACFDLLIRQLKREGPQDNVMLTQQIAVRDSAPIDRAVLESNNLSVWEG